MGCDVTLGTFYDDLDDVEKIDDSRVIERMRRMRIFLWATAIRRD